MKAYMLFHKVISRYKVGKAKIFYGNIYSENYQFQKNTNRITATCLPKCFLTKTKERSLFKAFEFRATSGFGFVILEPIEAEPLATCVASHPAERCLFSFQASLTPSLTHFYGSMSSLNGSFLNGMLTG